MHKKDLSGQIATASQNEVICLARLQSAIRVSTLLQIVPEGAARGAWECLACAPEERQVALVPWQKEFNLTRFCGKGEKERGDTH